ncbi:hypothetical protein ABZ371_27195 [Streptomyces sp. NPDC005899]|uniref:hypothetical protein n=1 Tax=Streptomyces sp. NPDC005899 TaxID=3155716 RepID=UPI0033F0E48F
MPPLLLVLVVLLDHYEERLLRSPVTAPPARERHLSPVPPPVEAPAGGPGLPLLDRAA